LPRSIHLLMPFSNDGEENLRRPPPREREGRGGGGRGDAEEEGGVVFDGTDKKRRRSDPPGTTAATTTTTTTTMVIVEPSRDPRVGPILGKLSEKLAGLTRGDLRRLINRETPPPPPPRRRGPNKNGKRGKRGKGYNEPEEKMIVKSKDSIREIQADRYEIFLRATGKASDAIDEIWKDVADELRRDGLLPPVPEDGIDAKGWLIDHAVSRAMEDPRIGHDDDNDQHEFDNFSLIVTYGDVPGQAPHVDLLMPNHQVRTFPFRQNHLV